MKLLEKLAISTVAFLIIYAFISIGMRMLELATVYTCHMVGGIVATIVGIGILMYMLLKKSPDKD